MNTVPETLLSVLHRGRLQKLTLGAAVLLSFVAGSLFAAGWRRISHVRADSSGSSN
jgi:hypothetical protein